jgi:hypothetical protein
VWGDEGSAIPPVSYGRANSSGRRGRAVRSAGPMADSSSHGMTGRLGKTAPCHGARRVAGSSLGMTSPGSQAGGLVSFLTSTFDRRPLASYFARLPGGSSSGVPSAKPAFDWK